MFESVTGLHHGSMRPKLGACNPMQICGHRVLRTLHSSLTHLHQELSSIGLQSTQLKDWLQASSTALSQHECREVASKSYMHSVSLTHQACVRSALHMARRYYTPGQYIHTGKSTWARNCGNIHTSSSTYTLNLLRCTCVRCAFVLALGCDKEASESCDTSIRCSYPSQLHRLRGFLDGVLQNTRRRSKLNMDSEGDTVFRIFPIQKHARNMQAWLSHKQKNIDFVS